MAIFCENCGWLGENQLSVWGVHIDFSGSEPKPLYDYRCRLCGLPAWEDDCNEDKERERA